ncbi:MAG: D-alanine--D-alanine ligase [Bacteroidales bacterium]|nr:D-alanine--D-alanine ligase [Bacteroidales bacterium]
MKRTIAIVAGGDSSEFGVSLLSARGIYSFFDKEKYSVYVVKLIGSSWTVLLNFDEALGAENPNIEEITLDKNDFSFMLNHQKINFDYAYITIHGEPGENGCLQGYLNMVGVPHSTCGVLAASLTYNKFMCSQYLKGYGITVAESMQIKKGKVTISDVINEVKLRIGYPCFVKPNLGGSSFGITKVKEEKDLAFAIEKAFDEDEEVVIEAFLDGVEVTCGCYSINNKKVALPLTEVVTHNEFFDFNAKYKGEVDEITPARISEKLTERIQKLTKRIYDILDCAGIIRIDYIVTESERINLLEVNTTPGMTSTSFIPQQVSAAGLSMSQLLTDLVESAFE